MKEPLVVVDGGETADPHAPTVAFRHLAALWLQITGTWCNLECIHCINASGPTDPWLKPLDAETAHHTSGHRLRVTNTAEDAATARAVPMAAAFTWSASQCAPFCIERP